MTIRRAVQFLALVLVAFVAAPFPIASADGEWLKIDQAEAAPDSDLHLIGGGYEPKSISDILFDKTIVGKATANDQGGMDFKMRVPAVCPPACPGIHFISVRQANVQVLVHTDWSQKGYNAAGTSSNLAENSLRPAYGFRTKWDMSFSSGREASEQVVNSRYVFTGLHLSNDVMTVVALDPRTGAPGWQVPLGPGHAGPPNLAYASGVVYVQADSQPLRTLDSLSGRAGWTDTACLPKTDYPKENLLSVHVTDGVVIQSRTRTVCASDAQTGRLLWKRDAYNAWDTPPGTPRVYGEVAAHAGGVVVQYQVLFPSGCCYNRVEEHIASLNVRTGAVLWDRLMQTDRRGTLVATAPGGIAISAGRIYKYAALYAPKSLTVCISNCPPPYHNLQVTAYDEYSGGTIWNTYYGEGANRGVCTSTLEATECPPFSSLFSGASVAPGTFYAAVGDGGLLAIADDTGQPLWRSTGTTLIARPTVAGTNIYGIARSTSGTSLIAVNPNSGSTVSTQSLTSDRFIDATQPVVSDGGIYTVLDRGGRGLALSTNPPG